MAKKNISSLNPEQLSAVEHGYGPLLIVAGAGTGKTTVITERIKYLIAKELAKPEEILALTFTEKAAREMEVRVDETMPYGTFGMWISTFHSFCDRILRSEALHIGLNPQYKLMTQAETYLLVKNNFWKFDLHYFRPVGNPYKFIESMIQHFDRLKDEDVSPHEYSEWLKNKKLPNKKIQNISKSENAEELESVEKSAEMIRAFETYEKLKIGENVMDFSDLIGNTLKLFRASKSVLAKYHKQFKYILIDEFQDTNFAQYELIKLFAPIANKPNLTVVGDDSQSIYKFRGAAISNILSFMKDYPKAKQIILTKNYRSSQTILDASYKLIKHNDPDTLESQLGINKNLIAQGKGAGNKVDVIYVDRVETEAHAVITKINDLKLKNPEIEYKDFAILVRANAHNEPFVKALERAGIPYQFLGPGALFHQAEVKDLIAYLKVLYDFTDSVSLYRVLSMPIWNLSQRDLIYILNYGKKLNQSLFESLEKISSISGVSPETAEIVTNFVALVHRHQELISKESAGQILYYFLEDSGILKNIVEYKTQIDERRAQNITKFFDKLKSFESTNKDASIFAVVDYLNLAMDMGESPLAAETDWSENNAVNILTLHSAKGLEFPVVFLVNLVEGRFPTRERKEQIPIPDELIRDVLPTGDYHLEEERRLFYVGMTRAKEKLIFSAANFYGEGKRERKLSPFISEALGEDAVRLLSTVYAKDETQMPLFEWKKDQNGAKSDDLLNSGQKVDFLSYSAIEAFRICPLHYKLRQILKISTPPTSALSMGNSIHSALKDFYSQDDRTRNKLLALLENNWLSEGYTSKKHEQESYAKSKKFLEEYFSSDLHKTANPIMLEQPFTFKVDNTLKIGGKIDRVDEHKDGTIEIIDYKTGANVPSQKDIDQNLQMTIYALAASDPGVLNRSVSKVKLSFYFFDTAAKVSTSRTKEQLDAAKEELLAIRDEIEKSDLKCSKGQFCQNCEFKMLCNS